MPTPGGGFFAVVGTHCAGEVGMNVVGCTIVGCAGALGGGTLNHLLVGRGGPVFWMADPRFLLFAAVSSVATFYLWPAAESALVNHDGKLLLDKPVYLDVQRSLGTFEMLHVPHGSKRPKFRYSYALSAWFTLNPQPPNARAAFTRYTPILNYGGKPTVSYNMQKGMLRVRSDAGEGKVTIAEVTGVALQTWNNLVINNDAGTMDVFLNGELIGSHPGIAPFMRYEEVLAGETHGLEGGICNVVYHPEPMSQSRIRMGYKMLRDRFPPTFS